MKLNLDKDHATNLHILWTTFSSFTVVVQNIWSNISRFFLLQKTLAVTQHLSISLQLSPTTLSCSSVCKLDDSVRRGYEICDCSCVCNHGGLCEWSLPLPHFLLSWGVLMQRLDVFSWIGNFSSTAVQLSLKQLLKCKWNFHSVLCYELQIQCVGDITLIRVKKSEFFLLYMSHLLMKIALSKIWCLRKI